MMPTVLRRVQCDRKARDWWASVPEDERSAIERAVPDGHYLTILHTNATPPFSVRLLRTTPDPGVNILVAHRRGYVIAQTVAATLAAAEPAA